MKNSKKEKPLVSVVLATYNSRRTIERCLLSVKNQTYSNIEIIVVDALAYDTNEKEKCKNIISNYASYYQDGPERSIQRNRGIKEAGGQYILVIDQDMYLTSRVVEECVLTIEKHDAVALLIPEISIGEGYWTECVALDRYISNYLETSGNECVRFFKKSDAKKIGGYDPEIVGAEDSDFHLRLTKNKKVKKINAHIDHDEGKTSFINRVKKKYYYSKSFREYLRRYPDAAPRQFSPFKINYLKHWKLLISKPRVTLGMFILRGSEVMAGLVGILIN